MDSNLSLLKLIENYLQSTKAPPKLNTYWRCNGNLLLLGTVKITPNGNPAI